MGHRLHAYAWRLLALTMALLIGLGMLPGAVATGTVSAQAGELSQDEFEELIQAAQEEDPVFGPEEGELPHDPDIVTLEPANVDLADFLAVVSFGNPYAGDTAQFDYGIQFRTASIDGGTQFLRFIVVSTGVWGLTDGEDVIDTGSYDDLDVSRRGENELIVYAEGDTVHLGINGDYLATIEVPFDDEGEISVGTSFLVESFQEDEVTEFYDFTIWEVAPAGAGRADDVPLGPRDEPAPEEEEPTATEEAPTDEEEPTATEEIEPTPTEEAEEPTPTEEPAEEPAPTEEATEEPTPTEEPAEEPTATPDEEPAEAEGTVYESPTYGYTLAYDDTWEVRRDAVQNGFDVLEISNGPSNLQFLGFETDQTPTECIDGIVASLEANPSVASVETAANEDDQPMRGDGETEAYIVVYVQYASEAGAVVTFGAYYTCVTLVEGEAMLQITHLTPIAQYNDEIENRAAVLDTLELDGERLLGDAAPPPPTDEEPTPTVVDTPADEEPTPAADEATPTDDLPEGAVAVYLAPMTDADTSAIGSLVPSDTGTDVVLFVLLSESGVDYVVTVNTGTCQSPGPVEHEVGTADAAGLLEGSIDAQVEELTTGDFIMVLAAADAPDEPVACGNLADLAE